MTPYAPAAARFRMFAAAAATAAASMPACAMAVPWRIDTVTSDDTMSPARKYYGYAGDRI